MSEAGAASNKQSGSSDLHRVLLRSRWGARLAALLLGIMVIAAAAQAYHLTLHRSPYDPFGRMLLRDAPGAWLDISHAILRLVFAAWFLKINLRYLRLLRHQRLENDRFIGHSTSSETPLQTDVVETFDTHQFVELSSHFWTVAGWGVMCSIIWSCFFIAGLLGLLPQFSTAWEPKRIVFSNAARPPTSVEFREERHPDHLGVSKYEYFVKEPVGKLIYLGSESIIDINDIARAKPDVDDEGRAILNVSLTDTGAAKFNTATKSLIGKRIAILFNGLRV
ncbi:MAG: hypothetical protein JWP89_561 [Schlesneria sp.]|nr:hypothetical protein [Schlesneria sp.]